MKRLKASEVPMFRSSKLKLQGGLCSLCGLEVDRKEAVLDHDHKTGVCRGILHRGCNSMLGKIENAMVRYKLTNLEQLKQFLHSVIPYITAEGLGVLHHTHRTADEKRELRNKRARKKRKAAKTGASNAEE